MAWSDFFLPSGAQTADEAEANAARQKALLEERLAARQAEGTLSDDQAARYQSELMLAMNDQNAAAWEGFKEGAAEGLNNVLNAPGKVVGAVGSSLSQAVWGVLKNIPWWVWLVGLGALFVWMGGLSLLRGRLARR